MKLKPIGTVKNIFKEPADPFEMQKHESTIIIFPEYTEGLYKIDQLEFIDIYFQFHKSSEFKLRGPRYHGEEKGVFASRSPQRPNGIGHTTVKLMEVKDNILRVSGLDAIDATPVLDIKPCSISFLKGNYEKIETNMLKINPRWNIIPDIKNNNLENLLLTAGKIHGHFCPGLASGVMAATYAMQNVRKFSDGLEDLMVIIETNSCFADGVQTITGCTFGNNAMVYKDLGKTAFSLVNRDSGLGIRIRTKNEWHDKLRDRFPKFFEIFQEVIVNKNHDPDLKTQMRSAGMKTSFEMLSMKYEELFDVTSMSATLPDYAPIHESILCSDCGELVMSSRIHAPSEKCLACSKSDYGQLTGDGISYTGA